MREGLKGREIGHISHLRLFGPNISTFNLAFTRLLERQMVPFFETVAPCLQIPSAR